MFKGISTVLLLVCSNIFMTFAWYGHLKFREMTWFQNLGLISIVLISWGIALTVFTLFTILLFKAETFRVNHFIGFLFLILAVYFIFKK